MDAQHGGLPDVARLFRGATGGRPAGGEGDAFARSPARWPCGSSNDRPPCLETPWHYFRHDLTPNEAFYVRWHLQAVPASIDVRAWRAPRRRAVDRPLELTMEELRRMEGDEVVAVNQCSATPAACSGPRVAGRNGGTGRMGNARWAGVGLARLLRNGGVRRGCRAGGRSTDSMRGLLARCPIFVKALDIDHALQGV